MKGPVKTFRVYLHVCSKNRKGYVGMTGKTVEKRFYEHCYSARTGSSFAFHQAIRKYGEDCWVSEVLAEVGTREEALEEEVRFIKEKNTQKNGYNMTPGGDGVLSPRTKEHNLAISKALTGRKLSAKTIEKLKARPKSYGKKQSQIWKDIVFNATAGSYLITFPDGRVEETKGLVSFCKNNKLSITQMRQLHLGHIKKYKGYKCERIDSYSFFKDKNPYLIIEEKEIEKYLSSEDKASFLKIYETLTTLSGNRPICVDISHPEYEKVKGYVEKRTVKT